MRAGPLSDSKIINILNSYFVPVMLSTEDVFLATENRKEAIASYHSMFNEFSRAGKPVGSVHVYLFSPDGKPLDAISVGPACELETLTAFLKKNIQAVGVQPGPTLIAPKPLSAPPKLGRGFVSLHLTVRGDAVGDWRQHPAENWIQLDPSEQKQLLGNPAAPLGASWKLDTLLTRKLLMNFYPATEDTNTKNDRNQYEITEIVCRRITGPGGAPIVRMDGKLRMKRATQPTGRDVRDLYAYLAGYIKYDIKTAEILDFKLATQEAVFGEEGFSAGMRLANAQ